MEVLKSFVIASKNVIFIRQICNKETCVSLHLLLLCDVVTSRNQGDTVTSRNKGDMVKLLNEGDTEARSMQFLLLELAYVVCQNHKAYTYTSSAAFLRYALHCDAH